ncbi:MAG: hypothetical protein Q4C75_05085 [Bergeyella zoohelcum]|nr:hypothetical protein [Bergeyella zoohelcum]
MMDISNFFIKSSMHTALNIYTSALFLNESIYLGIIWLGISFIVAITRIILKKHSVKEIFFGTILGSLISFLYLYIGIQN